MRPLESRQQALLLFLLALLLRGIAVTRTAVIFNDGPIFLGRAFGSNVEDVDGNRFVDLMAGFGASSLGYGEPELIQALASQAGTLSHAMGDVYPAAVKVQLLETLTRVLPGDVITVGESFF